MEHYIDRDMDMRGQGGHAIEMTNVLTKPEQFFAELSARGASLKTPFVIVLIAAIVAAISNAMASGVMAPSFPRGAGASMYRSATIRVIRGFIVPFGSWLLCSGVFYGISRLFRGHGSFERVFEFVGYGFIPNIVGSVIELVVIMVVPQNELLFESFQQIHPLILVFSIIQLLLMLCTVIIWIFAVKQARNIGTKHAIITVLAMPAILCLLGGVILCLVYAGVM